MIKEQFLEILVDICEDSSVTENMDMDLLETGLLDSLDFAELLATIEEEFDVVLSPSEFQREDLNTPNKILEVIESRR